MVSKQILCFEDGLVDRCLNTGCSQKIAFFEIKIFAFHSPVQGLVKDPICILCLIYRRVFDYTPDQLLRHLTFRFSGVAAEDEFLDLSRGPRDLVLRVV